MASQGSLPAAPPSGQPTTQELTDSINSFTALLQSTQAPQNVLDNFYQVVSLARQSIPPGNTTPAMQQQIATLQNQVAQLSTQITAQQQRSNVQSHTTTLANSAKVKVEKPPSFDGTITKFRKWRFALEQYFQIVNFTVPQEQAKFAVTLLTGKAFTWWQMYSRSHQLGIIELDELLNEMEIVFKDEDRERKLLSSFENIRQQNDVYQYINKFKTLVLELDSLVTTDMVLHRFVSGLKPEIQKDVLLQTQITTLSDAVLAAERVQAALNFVKHGRS